MKLAYSVPFCNPVEAHIDNVVKSYNRKIVTLCKCLFQSSEVVLSFAVVVAKALPYKNTQSFAFVNSYCLSHSDFDLRYFS